MKIRVVKKTYDEVMAMPKVPHVKPVKQLFLFRYLIRLLSAWELWRANFKFTKIGMEGIGKDEPCLYLMNHSSFIDLKIATTMLCEKPFNIVCTSDGFVGKNWLMRLIGCISTRKFITDITLVSDMMYAVRKLNSSILMYPEASYSFDGTATPLPEGLGKCIKMLKVPVVMIRTYGAFLRDPLYNGLQIRKVDVSAEMECILSKEQVAALSPEDINDILEKEFSFDHFKWQRENGILVKENFRADGLNRVLYKCPHCQTEGRMEGKGTYLTCQNCGKQYQLTEQGSMKAVAGNTEFEHIPDWYRWQRECVRKELEDGTYRMEVPVDICMMVNTKAVYKVGTGTLLHTEEGFQLNGCEGKLDYHQNPLLSYSLYSDFFWYEIGDVICIGNNKVLFYCFPHTTDDVVAKARLATEELYKLKQADRQAGRKVSV